MCVCMSGIAIAIASANASVCPSKSFVVVVCASSFSLLARSLANEKQQRTSQPESKSDRQVGENLNFYHPSLNFSVKVYSKGLRLELKRASKRGRASEQQATDR